MEASISFLKEAVDFKEINGSEKVFAYSAEWDKRIRWVDKGYGIKDTNWVSEKDPVLPEKIIIEVNQYDMTRHIDTTEVVRFYGKEIFKQSDDWGRATIIRISGFKHELNECDSEYEVLEKIKHIKKKGHIEKKLDDLRNLGLSDSQANAFMKSNTLLKWDHVKMKSDIIKIDAYPASVFFELANTKGKHEFNKLAKNWGLDALCNFYFPTAKLYAQQIYFVKKNS